MYEVRNGPPTSVERQRHLEALYRRLRDEYLTDERIGWALLLAVVVYMIATTDWSATGSSSADVLATVTIGDVLETLAWIAAVGVACVAITAVHEACHLAAFTYFGYRAEWTIRWVRVAGYPVYPAGGLCWPVPLEPAMRMSYLEDVVVSLAPLVFTVAVAVPVVGYHTFVDPFTSLSWVLIGVLAVTGPSPPDYASLLQTPRERWETVLDFEATLECHRAAEGYP